MTLPLLGLYLLLMLLIGVVNRRHADEQSGFFVAGRRSGVWLVTASLTATIIGASATLGLAANAWRDGLPAAWWLLSGTAGLLVSAFAYAATMRQHGAYTLPGLLGDWYGPAVRRLVAGVIAFAWLGVIAAQLVGAGAVMHQVAGGRGEQWTVACALALVAYTAMGGQFSVLRTDAWQLLLMVAGFAVALCYGLAAVGGPHGLAVAVPADLLRFPCNSAMPPGKVATWLVVVGLPYAVGPDLVGRLLSARDPATARRAALLTAAALVPLAFGIATLGLIARALDPAAPPTQALLTTLAGCLPPWAAGWLAAALLAAMMSSASTCLLTASTVLVADACAVRRDLVRWTRLAVVIVGLAATAVALRLGDIIGALLWAYALFSGGVVAPVLLGRWRERLHLTATGAIAAVVTGGGVALAGTALRCDWAVAAMALSALVLLAGRRPPKGCAGAGGES